MKHISIDRLTIRQTKRSWLRSAGRHVVIMTGESFGSKGEIGQEYIRFVNGFACPICKV